MNNLQKPRTILHFDLDAFFCSVEVLLDPKLKGKAFVVGGSVESRGVVASASYEAREYGIHSAMPTAQAMRLAPHLLVISHRHGIYSEYSHKVMELVRESTPRVQQISIDEAFLDVSDERRPGRVIAAAFQEAIDQRFGLPTSWGVATNKLVAKIATEVGKPKGLIVVPPGTEEEFLAPLPVRMIPGVGPKMQEKLEARSIQLIGELARVDAPTMLRWFGNYGPELAAKARGEDDRPVDESHEPKSMSAERTFATDIADEAQLQRVLLRLSEEVGHRLRKAGLAGWTVKLKVRWPDFTTITRQIRLDQNTDDDGEIFTQANILFHDVWRPGKAVRLLGVGVSDLHTPIRQLSLFEGNWKETQHLKTALDEIRERFGPDAVRRAAGLKPGSKEDRDD
ncbi:MAG: DNA polymerase IV [Anaerolineales bacterium]